MQPYVLAISLLLMIAVAAVFWWAVRNSAADAQGATTGQVESYRAGLFWALVGFGLSSRSRRCGRGRMTCQPPKTRSSLPRPAANGVGKSRPKSCRSADLSYLRSPAMT